MTKELSAQMNLPENTILLVEVGSTAHGTGLPGGEDQDETAIFIESAQQVFFRPAEGAMQRKWEQSVNFLAKVTNDLRLVSASVTTSALTAQQLVTLAVIIVGVYLIRDNALTRAPIAPAP